MKPIQHITLVIVLLLVAACKKTPEPTPVPTSDFRSDIVGEYKLTYIDTTYWHRDMKPGDTTHTKYTDDVTISYSISDSVKIVSFTYGDTLLPAIIFTWHGSGKIERFGMLSDAHLCGTGRYSEGWFINKDSIAYSKSDHGVSFDWWAKINGRRK